MESQETLLHDNLEYWTHRAPGYSEVNRWELRTDQRERWRACLRGELERQFPNQAPERLRVLDIGTGPGFFAILLCELGCRVTAIDLTPSMLAEAQKNSGPLAEKIQYLEMNAEALTFPDGSFDVAVSRNLTWNLPHPAKAYCEWVRVLKPGGLLLNFDANWYAYLFDASAAKDYAQDRQNSARAGVGDQNVGENFDCMETLARSMPLSPVRRPDWDLKLLAGLGMTGEADRDVWRRVWSESEKINFASTPMFCVRAVKRSRLDG